MRDERDEARLFAREHAHYAIDLPHWRGLAERRGDPVLELGCATGRVSVDLARAGHRVVALDRSPAMLDELRSRLAGEPAAVRDRVRPVLGDISDLRLEEAFPLVIAPMNTLQVLLAPEDRRRAFAGVARHLAPGGGFHFDVALPDPDEILAGIGVERGGGIHRDEGGSVRHAAWYDAYDPESGTVEFTLAVEHRDPAGRRVRRRRHRVHLYSPEELAGLLDRAGLSVESVAGDFAGGPLRPGGERQVWGCVRPAAG